MAIFNNSTFSSVLEQDENTITEMYPHIMPTVEAAYEIACEGYGDVHKLVAGLYISDVLIESAVREGAEVEPLIEGAVKDFLAKVKAKFIEIKNKIVAWFKKIFDNLKIRFTSTNDFVKKYKDRILQRAKVVKGYSVSKHDFDTDVCGVIDGAISKIVDFAKKDADEKFKNKAKIDGDKFVENMCKTVDSKATNISELKTRITEKLVGDEHVGSVGSSEASAMIKFCEGIQKTLSELDKLKNKNVDTINKAISDIEKAAKDSENDKVAERVHLLVKNYNVAINAMQGLNAIAVSVVNQINREYVSILRGLMLYKNANESFTSDEGLMGESANSIFESALSVY